MTISIYQKIEKEFLKKRRNKMNLRIPLGILLSLAIFASGLAAAQPGTFGTKVTSGDPDIGLPLSNLAPIGGVAPGGATTQLSAFISYWDVGATPGIFDDQDVVYLQFGSWFTGPQRIVRANNVRLTGWGNFPAGSYVNQGDSDLGQQLLPWGPVPTPPDDFASAFTTGFWYMNVGGSAGYDLGDPVYLKTEVNSLFPASTSTNDVRITANAGFPAGSRVSLSDPDAARQLTAFEVAPPAYTASGGPQAQLPFVVRPIAKLAFYNANGNVLAVGNAIYDTGDVVYLDVNPIGIVSPNDVRLF
jgi:hypothetical protein